MTECKSCGYLNITIVPPSDEQYCTKKGTYVQITNCCVDYIYDNDSPFVKGDVE